MKIAVLLSGNGSNLQALITAARTGGLPAEIVLVLSDNPAAYGLKRAQDAGIKALYLPAGPSRTTLSGQAEERYVTALQEAGVQLVCLAGFMRVIKRRMLRAFPGKILNIHPSLLPSFPGLEAGKQALEYGVRYTGCTVHLVEEGVDTGPIIMQAVVPVNDDDTTESLVERIHREEHRIYPEAVKFFAREQLEISGRRVIIR